MNPPYLLPVAYEVKALPKVAVIIDDSYNASPSSVRAAIDVLASSAGRRILVLGDMAELGADAEDLHQQVGEYALKPALMRCIRWAI